MRGNARLIDAAGLRKRIGSSGLHIVDCRFDLMRPDAGVNLYRDGHIPSAVYADLDSDLASPVTVNSGRHPLPDWRKFRNFLGQSGISNDSSVVVYDQQSGALAARLWWLLRCFGHDDVSLLDGGFAAWTNEGFSTEPGEVAAMPSAYLGTPDQSSIVTTDELVGLTQKSPGPMLVDAREADRFLGRAEPIDTVAGHIPGALSFPVSQSLGSDGKWLPPDKLTDEWVKILPERPEGAWIVMCGSGVTACHLSFSAQRAGLAAPQVYVGSWSEWIRDPRRPIATEGP